jgi:hypothetical protein
MTLHYSLDDLFLFAFEIVETEVFMQMKPFRLIFRFTALVGAIRDWVPLPKVWKALPALKLVSSSTDLCERLIFLLPFSLPFDFGELFSLLQLVLSPRIHILFRHYSCHLF